MNVLSFLKGNLPYRDRKALSSAGSDAIKISELQIKRAKKLSKEAGKVNDSLNHELRVKNHVSERFKEALKGHI